MAQRKAYPLRIDAAVFDAVARWAGDDLRSINAQIEFALRIALAKAGRLPRASTTALDATPTTNPAAETRAPNLSAQEDESNEEQGRRPARDR